MKGANYPWGIPADPEDLDFCRSSDCNTNLGLGHGVARVGAVQIFSAWGGSTVGL